MWHFIVISLFLFSEMGQQAASQIFKNQATLATCAESCFPSDCDDVKLQGLTSDGVYLIYPAGPSSTPLPVYCDMTSKDGPWTVIQKRFDGSVNFYRGWEDYKHGFGQANGEFWLGLRNIHLLTQKKSCRLRIDLEDFEGDQRFVTYRTFALSPLAISPEEDGYRLKIDGFQEGDSAKPMGNSLSGFSDVAFSTYDNDRDLYSGNCATMYQGAFWYTQCHNANLNGKYLKGTTSEYATALVWSTWKGYKYSLKRSEMKIASSRSA